MGLLQPSPPPPPAVLPVFMAVGRACPHIPAETPMAPVRGSSRVKSARLSRGPGTRQGAPGHSPGSATGLCPALTRVAGYIICLCAQVRKTGRPAWVHTLVQLLIHTQQAFRAHICENEIFIRINLNPLKIHYLESNSFPIWHTSGIVIHTLLVTSQLTEVGI